jgi:ZIP family zinc transporter
MWSALLWGFVAASSLVLGGVLACWLTLGKRTLGVIMAFGAGVLISAVAYELVFEAVRLAGRSGVPTLGFMVGAFTFFFADRLIDRMGAGGRKDVDAAHQSALIVPLVLGSFSTGFPSPS